MSRVMDMTEGPITSQLFRFALPVLASSLLAQIYYLVDTFVITTWLGDGALGAVTSCLNLVWLITAVFFGIGMGMNVVAAQAFGAHDFAWMRKTVGTGIASTLIVSVILALVSWPISGPLLNMLKTPAEVFDLSMSYLVLVLAGSGGQMLFEICSGAVRAAGDSKTPLFVLAGTTILNIVLDIALVAWFGMGIAGAAAATVFSEVLSGLIMVGHLLRTKAEYGLKMQEIRIDGKALKEILRMGVPGAIEASATSFANTLVQAFINSFGTAAMAACGAFMSIEGFCFLPITAFCQAVGTFTGQNAGAGEKERTYKGVRISLLSLCLISFTTGLIILLALRPLLSIFLHTPEAMAYGMERGRITLLFYPVLGITHCLAAVFRGVGRPILPMVAYMGSWGVIRVLLLWLVLPHTDSFAFLCAVYPITWSISSLFLLICLWKLDWFQPARALEALAAD